MVARTKATRSPNVQNCPACDKPIIPPRASMSRYVNLYICSDCGVQEAAHGDFWYQKRRMLKPTQPADYDPWNTP